MPVILGTRTVFPVLRRGRRRASRHPQDSEEATHAATASHSEHVQDKSRIGEHVAAQATSPKYTRPTTIVNTTSSTSSTPGPTTDETPAIATPAHLHHQQRRRRRLSRFPAALNPRRASKTAVTPPQPPPAVDLPTPEDCPICQDPVGVPNPEGVTEALVQLQCGHRFGQTCIITWVIDSLNRDYLANPNCPVCRRDIVHPCGHLIVSREPPLISAALHENDSVEAVDGNGADHIGHVDTEVAPRQRRRVPVLSQVVVGAKVAVILSVVLARLVSHAMTRTIKLVRGWPGRARKPEQSIFLTGTSDEVQMMPPEGHCRICKEAAGETLEDDDEPQAE